MEVSVKNLVKALKLGKWKCKPSEALASKWRKGDIVSIIGSSGSGKTTLLNIIGGLDTATAGFVKVGEVEVTALSIPATGRVPATRRRPCLPNTESRPNAVGS